ncbi:GAF domain-containing sensor histidine kinase [Aliterella atlantica]|uniref:Circadian input-output histidine kinase CikA n=1 Tax=Aliterella atlantica CENA595 TaxID=1618023 RepID=A0A0D8ZPH4_9CYAN|nr:ATP-binding protein [Aliterella atlantica]KJH70693.1 histidine kinase [Aliterella atlantica CENA595]
MSVSANSEPPLSISTEAIGDRNSSSLWRDLGSELVFTQDVTGRYLSFYWQQAENFDLNAEQTVTRSLNETFAPVDLAAYLQRVQRIVSSMTPERCKCLFRYKQYLWSFELVISPIPSTSQTANRVLVMGRQLEQEATQQLSLTPQTVCQSIVVPSAESKKLLIHIARNIRRTLDLNTIWQQTVDSLGEALGVSHCIVCAYRENSEQVHVVAEYRQIPVRSMVGVEISIADDAGFSQALKTLEPVVVDQIDSPSFQQSLLVVATYYQGKPNGLISLRQCVRRSPKQKSDRSDLVTPPRQWTADEIELVREVAEQVGTAIAHATLYKELEEARIQAEEASRLKSEFLANTSHEIRTPLNGMLGFLKLILEGMADDPEEQQEFIKEAYGSAIHLLHILNDILDIAKIEAGKMELELGRVKLDDLFSHVENFTKPQAEQKNLSFMIQKPDTADEIVVYGNYKRLLQVMLNLVSNALKFTDEGGITISADVVRKKIVFQDYELPGIVKIRVVDTGIGVSLEKQEKLFQSFSQVDGTLTRPYGGTGLGLTISQKLVEAMGGEVYFFSMGEGLGSTVMFTVPLYQEPVMSSAPIDDSAN